jgi:hypothetical protein
MNFYVVMCCTSTGTPTLIAYRLLSPSLVILVLIHNRFAFSLYKSMCSRSDSRPACPATTGARFILLGSINSIHTTNRDQGALVLRGHLRPQYLGTLVVQCYAAARYALDVLLQVRSLFVDELIVCQRN